ncbi:MAG: cysteine desulfurase [Rhodospirillales bacterium]
MSVALRIATADGVDELPLDVDAVRGEFPIMSQTVHGRPLVYLDSAASAQKPRCVLDAMQAAYETTYANVHRGIHLLSQQATDAFEAARTKVARFLNAGSPDEIVYVRGATEGINLVAASYGRSALGPGDEIILSELEHHANIVPWQLLQEDRGVVLKVIPIDDRGALRLDVLAELISARTKLVAVTHVSNAVGTINPVAEIIEIAHAHGAVVLIDGCQAVQHMRVDVRALDADFYVFSGHKVYGPTGIGVLYGKKGLLDRMPPYQGGGEMILTVSFEKTTFKDPPHRFEAGTPAIVEAIGLGAAIDFLSSLDVERIAAHEQDLLAYATARAAEIPGMTIYGAASLKAPVLSFTLDGIHPHDIGTILDRAGIAVRAGHHCAQPLMERLGVAATARASFALYNTRAEVDALIDGLHLVRRLFG